MKFSCFYVVFFRSIKFCNNMSIQHVVFVYLWSRRCVKTVNMCFFCSLFVGWSMVVFRNKHLHPFLFWGDWKGAQEEWCRTLTHSWWWRHILGSAKHVILWVHRSKDNKKNSLRKAYLMVSFYENRRCFLSFYFFLVMLYYCWRF